MVFWHFLRDPPASAFLVCDQRGVPPSLATPNFWFMLRLFWNQMWWFMPVIPALGRRKPENHEFEDDVGYIVNSRPVRDKSMRSCLKKKERKLLMGVSEACRDCALFGYSSD